MTAGQGPLRGRASEDAHQVCPGVERFDAAIGRSILGRRIFLRLADSVGLMVRFRWMIGRDSVGKLRSGAPESNGSTISRIAVAIPQQKHKPSSWGYSTVQPRDY
jgi:hypothetical protein